MIFLVKKNNRTRSISRIAGVGVGMLSGIILTYNLNETGCVVIQAKLNVFPSRIGKTLSPRTSFLKFCARQICETIEIKKQQLH